MQHIQMHFTMHFLQGIDTNEIRPGHNTGSSTPNSLRIVYGFFYVSLVLREQWRLWDGAYGLLPLSEKTWKSNHLRM